MAIRTRKEIKDRAFIVASRAKKETKDLETPELPDLPGIIKPNNRLTLEETQLFN